MKIAKVVSERSTCSRAKVGAVLIDPVNSRIVATGYNGAPKRAKHCIEHGCLMYEGHCIRTIHAEINAVLHLEHSYPVLHLYTTHQPCLQCTKALIGANVVQVMYLEPYEDKGRDLLLREVDISFIKVSL